MLRSVISQQRIPYTNQAGALINAIKAVGEQLIAANPVGRPLYCLHSKSWVEGRSFDFLRKFHRIAHKYQIIENQVKSRSFRREGEIGKAVEEFPS